MIEIRRDERRTVFIAVLYFALVMAGWFMLRPLREDSGSENSADERAVLYTWTFGCSLPAVPLYSWLVSAFDRRRLLVALYALFCLNLVGFWWCESRGWFPESLDRVFYVWASVFNLLVVAIFWSVVVDVFDAEQGKRLFGIVAAGGSIGALVGSQVTKSYFEHVARSGLYLIAMAVLIACAGCAVALLRWGRPRAPQEARGTGGSWLGGFTLVLRRPYLLALAAQTLCITFGSTILYSEKLELVASLYSRGDRPRIFATIDQYTNYATLIGQGFVTAWILRRGGLRFALGFLPVLGVIGFALLAWLLDASSLTNAFYLVAGFEILRKAAHHVFEKPAREVLFTVVTREEKYKAKEFLDVSVYRGGDCGGGWIYAAFHSAGRTLPAWSAVPLSALAFFVSGFLAREQRRLGEAKSAAGTDVANRG